jgi:glucose/arabinose dehydrogenase
MRHPIVAIAIIALAAASCAGESSPVSVPASSPTVAPSSTSTDAVGQATTTTLGSEQTPPTTLPLKDTILRLEAAADGFEQPVFYTTVGDRGYVVDQPGVIWTIVSGEDPSMFLDIRDRVRFSGEQGLLGLAFHPEYPDRLYVDYTASGGRTVVSEFTVGAVSRTADPATERVLLEVEQPAANHNGGMIAFGPRGYLWIGMGDGGASNDKFGNGQREDTLLGAMLRIVVGPEIETYEPVWIAGFAAEAVWAIGLRNPWRFSFDGEDLWIADVGQGDVEEINRVSAEDTMVNYGWPIYEGSDCFAGPCTGVDSSGRALTGPVYEYRHDEGCSITGGYVYRGDAIPQLDGHYFFSDWCTGFIRSIAPDGSVHDWTDGTGTIPAVSSFGRDDNGEIYVVSGTGTVYRIAEDRG